VFTSAELEVSQYWHSWEA